jgi:hypothetical protein
MASGKFITNTDKLLSDTINNILPSSENLYFLVWFFYFSWFQELYKKLEDKNMKVLVGMDVEVWIKNTVKEVFNLEQDVNVVKKQWFIDSLKQIINKSDLFDSKINKEALELFIKKIENWTLEIKKTLDPNHSKLYLFENKKDHSEWWEYPWSIITWSSNLTYSWLTWRYEFNSIFRDKEDFETAKSLFNELWDKSLPITTWWEDDDVVKMLKEETWLKVPKPYYCYLRLLFEYFENQEDIVTPFHITHWDFQDLQYQVSAIKDWIKMLKEHNWAIIADVVWLGKSIIWSAIIHNMHKKAIIIAPPHLIDQREEYKTMFDINAKIFSSWKIDDALEYNMKYKHKAWIVLIDEAHKYRNSDTNDYWNLHQICQWKKVILLTATPFNNEPKDIFNLVKLFQIPEVSTINTANNLMYEFSHLQKEYLDIRKEQRKWDSKDVEIKDKLKLIANKIRDLIWPVVIRRSRLDLKNSKIYKEDLQKQWYEFSEARDPETKTYKLAWLENKYIDTLNLLVERDDNDNWKNFKWARYKVLTYVDGNKYAKKLEEVLGYEYSLLEWRQKNMPFFIRRLLVSRFESSLHAFKNTLKSIRWSIDKYETYINKVQAIPVIKKWKLPDIEDFIDDYMEFEELQKEIDSAVSDKGGFMIPIQDIGQWFFDDLEKDKEFLDGLISLWGQERQDPKMVSFVEEVKKNIKDFPWRKIVVFSQYSDTIENLEEEMNKHWLRVLSVTWKNKPKWLKDEIKYNFDAWIKKEDQLDNYDILLGTDAISEWYNLHRAWTIYNYDIPYNPTRIIQRIWRINRINKKVFDELFIFNYFPSLIWEEIIRWKQISTLKIMMINAILWNDTKTLTEDEELQSFNKRVLKDWEDISDIYKEKMEEENFMQEEESWDTAYRDFLYEIQTEDKDIKNKVYEIADRSRLQRTEKKGKNWLLLFAKKWSNNVFKYYDKQTKEVIHISSKDAFDLFEAKKSEDPLNVSEDFYDCYEKIKLSFKQAKKATSRNTQEWKALDALDFLYEKTKETFYKDLKVAINLWNLPTYYMKEIRKITPKNYEEIVKFLKKEIYADYLQSMINYSQEFDDQKEDLIITEEF